jgi:hypothetical protein
MEKIEILPPNLYAYEAWSLSLTKERRLRVSENRAICRIFGNNRDDVTGENSET